MMARGHPRDARVEGVQERSVALPPRIGQADLERRPHHEALHLRLHDAIGTSRPGQSDLVAPHRDNDYPRLLSGHQQEAFGFRFRADGKLRPPGRLDEPLVFLVSAGVVSAQSVTLPPSGNNQKASVTQHIGLVTVTIEYSSPHTISPTGEDRRGKIWGTLVPYGIYDLGFNNRRGPWRAGANENTVFSVSHPVKVQGQTLAAGRYGLHMIAGEKEWTIIFSTLSTKAQILDKLSRTDEAKAVMATAVFQKNQKRYGDAWPVHVGLARGYSAMGDYNAALEHAQKALAQAPDTLNRNNLAAAIEKLKQGKDMNVGS
jgi:tetratricopeptide (TPR) repeat protein